MKINYCTDENKWNKLVNQAGGHPLQLWGWGEVKARGNWRVKRLYVEEQGRVVGGASLLVRSFPGPIPPLVYIPRGPFGEPDKRQGLLELIAEEAGQRWRPLAVSVEPDWQDFKFPRGWRQAKNTVLVPTTALVDLEQPEEAILATMTKKTRQYINKSSREAIEVRQVTSTDELESCLSVYRQTAERAGFGLHTERYYHDIFTSLGESNLIMGVWQGSELLAFLWLVVSDQTAFELYGGVNELGQKLRVNYTLKWQAMQTCKQRGVKHYDLNGLLNDGISNFKRGFVAKETEFVGTYDYKMSLWYPLYSTGLPLAKRLARVLKR